MGLFAKRDFNKNEFIGGYCSEILCRKEDECKDIIQKTFKNSYLFTSKNQSFNIVDAEYYGSYTRVINHLTSAYANVKVTDVKTPGYNIIVFLTTKKVSKNDELFFDYGEHYSLEWRER